MADLDPAFPQSNSYQQYTQTSFKERNSIYIHKDGTPTSEKKLLPACNCRKEKKIILVKVNPHGPTDYTYIRTRTHARTLSLLQISCRLTSGRPCFRPISARCSTAKSGVWCDASRARQMTARSRETCWVGK
jgi:hypothetical protein